MKDNNKRNISHYKKEYYGTLSAFLILLFVLFSTFFAISYIGKLSSKKNDVNNICNILVLNFNRYIEDINKTSKKIFINEELLIEQDKYAISNDNNNLQEYIDQQYEIYSSSLIVGTGYIPLYNNEYKCEDIIYKGIKTVSFNYEIYESKEMIDKIVEISSDEKYSKGRMFLLYDKFSDIHIFARLINDIRPQSFDKNQGIGFVIVNSATFRQARNIGDVVEGLYTTVTYDGNSIFEDKYNFEEINVTSSYVYKTNFSQYCEFIGLYNKTFILNELLKDSIPMIITYFIVIMLFVYFYKKIHDKYTKSFVYLINEFKKSGENILLENINLTKDDENANQVIKTYNQMVENFINEKNRNEKLLIENREFELQNLYLQINKHFIINVLSVAHSLIQLDQKEKTNECLENLADFLRYSLSINITEATLKDEFDLSLSYVKLQELRFPNVSFEYKINGEIKDIIVPKFIIQPLIENAYVHGIKSKNGLIKLNISRVENIINIAVINSGTSITVEELKEANNRIYDENIEEKFYGNGHRIALKNIRKRLIMKFGKNVKVFIEVKDNQTSSNIIINLEGDKKC